MTNLHTLQNQHWQVGILPQTGASVAFGRVRYSGAWVDILRPTDPEDYHNASQCSSFIMLPWANRIRDGVLRVGNDTYQLATSADDGTARHGVVRKKRWQVRSINETHIRLAYTTANDSDVNFPFAFSASVSYALEDDDFVMSLLLQNDDERPFPAGFGHHPYFVRSQGANMPQVQIPADAYIPLEAGLPTAGPQALPEALDYRRARPVDDTPRDDLFTRRRGDDPARIVYPAWHIGIEMHADPIFKHMLLFAPPGKPFFALEPQTNANDGFNLAAQGLGPASGVFGLRPGEAIGGDVRWRLTRVD